MGEERLKVELQAKGISEALAAQVAAEALRERDERVLARCALQAAQHRGRRLTAAQIGYLLRQRGFSEETIDRMIEESNEESGYEE